jgi:glycosyltransferase involved in cell wall biosynthesis
MKNFDMTRNVHFILFRYSHHSPHSGYSRLAEYGVEYFKGEVIRVAKPLPRSIVRDRIYWYLVKGTPGYDRASMAAELNVAMHMLRGKNSIFHFLYGETTYHYAGSFINSNKNQLVATFHLPPEGIRNAFQIDGPIRKLSAVICVGSTQMEYFSHIIDPKRIFFVPLGIDIEYYTPPANFESRNPDLCLIVGENYRDHPTLRGVIELVSYIRPQTKFVIVAPARSFDLIGKHPNLTLRSGIPESELLSLYRSASLSIMPLQDTTANNAILESMACGLPIIASDVGSIRDYLNPEVSALVPPYDARCMAETVVNLLNDPQKCQEMSSGARQHVLKFSWNEVLKLLAKVYSAIS